MIDLSDFRGIGIFGSAYKIMIENDSHAIGSVDRVLGKTMVKICSETAEYLYNYHTDTDLFYQKGSRPKLESQLDEIISLSSKKEEIIVNITRFVSGLVQKAEQDLDKVLIGGLEEEIIERGSDWCTDLARVGCVLCQVAGFPSRLVSMVDLNKAYSGHVIIEVYRFGVWGAVDPTTNVIYKHLNGVPASTWDLMNDSQLVDSHWRDGSTPYTYGDKFKAVGITNYFVWLWEKYDYSVSGVNDYYRFILEMSEKGWPGGQRWLHGEDNHL